MKHYLKEHWGYLTEAGKYPGIDVMRAIAIMAVVFFHFNFPLFRMGHLGVDLFFVISGFLIGGMIWDSIDKDKFSFRTFYKNRFLRILPVYYVIILLTILNNRYNVHVPDFALGNWETIKSTLFTAAFLQTALPYYFNINVVSSVIPDGSWTLVIEEFFYIVTPLLLVVSRKILGKNGTLALLVLLFVAGPFVRMYATSGFAPDDANWHFANYIQFHSRYDELLIGVVAAVLVRMDVKHPAIPALSFLGLGFCLTYLGSHPVLYDAPQFMTRATIWMPTVMSLSCAGLALSYASCQYKNTAVTAIARLSYPLYLGHILLMHVALHFEFFAPDLIKMLGSKHAANYLLVIASFIFSYLLSLIVEYPFIRLYKKPAAMKVSTELVPRHRLA
jgi:peptidoglycan/LPS O-acetylase OafA/YrhL